MIDPHGLAAVDVASLARSFDEFFGQGGVREAVTAIIEIGLLAWFFYAMLRFLHGTRGLAVLKGVLMFGVVVFLLLFAVSEILDLSFVRLEVAATYLLPTLVIGLVILFQPELRRGLSRLSERARGGKSAPTMLADLAAGFVNMSRQRTGALVVFEQATGIQGLYSSGVQLDAALSGAMLESIFYPKSPLHDGAVIVQGERIVAASTTLPLSDSTSLSRDFGTRHRAAIGVTEETDAVAVVVSEETGRITVVHHGELHPVDDEEDLVETFQDLLAAFQPADEGRGFHPWHWVRHDIGRKTFGLLVALLLWVGLQTQLVGDTDARLPIEIVKTQARAETLRRDQPAVYLVVPDGFIVRRSRLEDPSLNDDLRQGRVKIEYKGLKKDIANLDLSAVIVLDEADLGEVDDERMVGKTLDQARFRDKNGNQPPLIEFEASPSVLYIPLERQMSATLALSAANVTISGSPPPGYRFDETRFSMSPNSVKVSGPKARIEALLENPGLLQLEPVALAGKIGAVSQAVGLGRELTGEVTLETAGGTVLVTVLVVGEPESMDLLSVPVEYRNRETLTTRGLRLVSADPTLDLTISGPREVLAGRSEEWVRQRLTLSYDWAGASLLSAKERVAVWLGRELARPEVRVTLIDSQVEPEITYSLEELSTAAANGAEGGGG